LFSSKEFIDPKPYALERTAIKKGCDLALFSGDELLALSSSLMPDTPLCAPSKPTPSWPSVTALVIALLSMLIAIFVRSFNAWCVGYALGGLIAPAFVAAHRAIDNVRRSSIYHSTSTRQTRIVIAAIALTLIGASSNAWLVATELAKR